MPVELYCFQLIMDKTNGWILVSKSGKVRLSARFEVFKSGTTLLLSIHRCIC